MTTVREVFGNQYDFVLFIHFFHLGHFWNISSCRRNRNRQNQNLEMLINTSAWNIFKTQHSFGLHFGNLGEVLLVSDTPWKRWHWAVQLLEAVNRSPCLCYSPTAFLWASPQSQPEAAACKQHGEEAKRGTLALCFILINQERIRLQRKANTALPNLDAFVNLWAFAKPPRIPICCGS